MKKKDEYWVINVSKRDVSLGDLALIIPAGKYFNLLDKRNFSYTREQLEKSSKDGSLYKKSNKIKLCEGKPDFIPLPRKTLSKTPMIRRNRSAIKVIIPKYDELVFSDEKYADEISELFSNVDQEKS